MSGPLPDAGIIQLWDNCGREAGVMEEAGRVAVNTV
jgi:hypothetical protein